MGEVECLGITVSSAHVIEPECDGVIDRYLRTLEKQCLNLHRLANPPQTRSIIEYLI